MIGHSYEAFDYALPPERIAQRPVHPPEAARMLVVERQTGRATQRVFADLPELLNERDLLIFNQSRVIPARLFGEFQEGGGAVELLLLERREPGLWTALAKPLRRASAGRRIIISGDLSAEIIERDAQRATIVVRFHSAQGDVEAGIETAGVMPIPPYIRGGRADRQDRDDYQPIFARVDGSVAAPTASLHFSEALRRRLEARGVRLAFVTLHVGSASFRPLWAPGDTELTPPGEERFIYDPTILQAAQETRAAGGRVIVVGTTVMRAVESIAAGAAPGCSGDQARTALFIQPGFRFKVADSLITNFHQPRTTHLLLVEAFMGRSLLSQSYEFALQNGFRFLSYGDGMIIL